jgi:hypothetical protein
LRLHQLELRQQIDCNNAHSTIKTVPTATDTSKQLIHLRRVQKTLLQAAMCTILLLCKCSNPPEALPVDILQLVLQCVSIIPDTVCMRVLVLQLLIHALQQHTARHSTKQWQQQVASGRCRDTWCGTQPSMPGHQA